jgi:hypothetical protein
MLRQQHFIRKRFEIFLAVSGTRLAHMPPTLGDSASIETPKFHVFSNEEI